MGCHRPLTYCNIGPRHVTFLTAMEEFHVCILPSCRTPREPIFACSGEASLAGHAVSCNTRHCCPAGRKTAAVCCRDLRSRSPLPAHDAEFRGVELVAEPDHRAAGTRVFIPRAHQRRARCGQAAATAGKSRRGAQRNLDGGLLHVQTGHERPRPGSSPITMSPRSEIQMAYQHATSERRRSHLADLQIATDISHRAQS